MLSTARWSRTIGEYGYEPAVNQTDIVTPTFSSWYDSSLAAKYGNAYAYNPSKAISILKRPATRRAATGSSPRTANSSRSRSSTTAASRTGSPRQRHPERAKAVGIQVTPDNLSGSTFDSDVYDGKYQLAYHWDTAARRRTTSCASSSTRRTRPR